MGTGKKGRASGRKAGKDSLVSEGFMPDRVLEFRPHHQSTQIDWQGLIPTAAWLTAMCEPRRFVELGSYMGDSYCAFCQSIAEQEVSCEAFAVDLWEGDEHTGAYGPEVYAKLQDYHDPRYAHFSRLMRMEFDEAQGSFEDGSIDLLHIDGLHTYEAVKHDYEFWRPKVSERGVIILHDTMPRKRGFGVYKLWEEIEAECLCFNLPFSNGLGIVIADPENGPEQLVKFARLSEAERRPVVLMLKALGDMVVSQAKSAWRASELARAEKQVGDLTWSINDLRTRHRSELLDLLHLVCAEFPGLAERLEGIEGRIGRLEDSGIAPSASPAGEAAEIKPAGCDAQSD